MTRQLSRRRTAPVDVEAEGVADNEDDYPDEQEETRPARSRRSASKDRDEETHTSTRRPAGKRPASRTEPSTRRPGRSGWDGVKANKEKRFTGDEFKVKPDTSYLIHFLEDRPMEGGVFLEHFIKSLASNRQRASFVCLEDDCPLDDIGEKASDRALFNIAVLDDKGNATVMWWKATASVIDIIEDYADSERNSPIDRTDLYFEVSKKDAKNGIPAYKIDAIKARDLKDEGIDPLTDDELDDLREDMFGADVLDVTSKRDLRDIADELGD